MPDEGAVLDRLAARLEDILPAELVQRLSLADRMDILIAIREEWPVAYAAMVRVL